jgi:CRISPR-associated protein Cas2
VMIWRDKGHPGGQRVVALGAPPHEVVSWDGTLLVRRELTGPEKGALKM